MIDKPADAGDSQTSTDTSEASERLDAIDQQILALLNQRAALSMRAAQVKQAPSNTGIDTTGTDTLAERSSASIPADAYHPEQDARTLREICQLNKGPMDNQSLQCIFNEILSASRLLQTPLRVAYLGPEGTYSHTAAGRHFGHGVDAQPEPGIAEIFQAVEAGRARFGVVPVENSTEGAVNQTLDLLTQTSLRVCGEVGMRIQHCLLSNAATLQHIKEVHAHPQALAQCMHWLNANLPDAVRVSESSNAAAAKLAIERPEIAAIAGESAARLYHLTIMNKGIEDEKNNTTRFLVVGDQDIPPSGDDSSLLLVSAPHRPGGLRSMLGPLEDAGVSMTRIESRPSRSALWEYVFFINVNAHEHDEHLSLVLTQLREIAPLVKVLGSYPRAL